MRRIYLSAGECTRCGYRREPLASRKLKDVLSGKESVV